MTKHVINIVVVAMVVAMLAGLAMYLVTTNSWWLWLFIVPFIIFL